MSQQAQLDVLLQHHFQVDLVVGDKTSAVGEDEDSEAFVCGLRGRDQLQRIDKFKRGKGEGARGEAGCVDEAMTGGA